MTWQQLLFSFEGRVGRQWFWIVFATSVIAASLALLLNEFLAFIVAAALIWTNLAVGCKRLHDMGYSGWFQLIALTVIGTLVLIVWLGFVAGNPAENRFGSPPFNEAPSSWS